MVPDAADERGDALLSKGRLTVSEPVPAGLNFNQGERLEVLISQPFDKYEIEIRAVLRVRKGRKMETVHQTLDKRTLDSERELWIAMQRFVQSRLCDEADRSELGVK